jgi:hypothetical protein
MVERAGRAGASGRELAAQMVEAATGWLESLDADQRGRCLLPPPAAEPSADAERRRWYYTPTDHGGLALNAMRPRQQGLAMRLVATGLSEAGYVTVSSVMGLENVLDRLESWTRDWGFERGRDPGRYWMSVFGDPRDGQVWGWRFGGHHISLNFLLLGGDVVATTPCFIGADPAAAPLLGGEQLRPLAAAEDIARRLLSSLDHELRGAAILHVRAPSDIVSGNRPLVASGDQMLHMNEPELWRTSLDDPRLLDLAHQIDAAAEAGSGYREQDHRQIALPVRPSGVRGSLLDNSQRELLQALVAVYQGRVAPQLAPALDDVLLDQVSFAWAGGIRAGEPHYYRIEGPDLLIEYDNTQRSANHVHSVWRRPAADFGVDALREHRRRLHRT